MPLKKRKHSHIRFKGLFIFLDPPQQKAMKPQEFSLETFCPKSWNHFRTVRCNLSYGRSTSEVDVR